MLDHNRQYEMTVRPLGKSQADEYHHNGAIWIEGREGNHYTIDIKNNTYNRVLFVVSVDGLDVMDGKTAGLDSRGYILNGYQTLSIPGWSLNKDKVAEFYFSRDKDSYVNEIGGSTTNTGVIGAMVFSEKVIQNYPNHWGGTFIPTTPFIGTILGGPQYDSLLKGVIYNSTGSNIQSIRTAANSLPINSLQFTQIASINAASVSSESVSQDIGTGFGKETNFKTVEVNFEKANSSNPDCILAIYYNTAKNLERMGISLRRKHNVEHKANPFPNYASPSAGCKPPNGWRG